MRVNWHYLKTATPPIPWDAFTSVSTREVIEQGHSYQFIDLNLSFAKLSTVTWLLTCLIFDPLSLPIRIARGKQERATIAIANNRLLQSADTLKVLNYLRHYLPSEKINPSVELLCEQYEFTSLWLAQLITKTEEIQPKTKDSLLHCDRYQIIEAIGSGGQASTYVALDRSVGETVILKEFVLPVAGGREITEESLKHIQAEAKLIQSLHHPKIVKCLDQFCEGRRAYLVLNHIKGQTLLQHVQASGPMSENEVVLIALQMCDVIHHLHHNEPPVVHRDITPDNLILQDDGAVVLLDFNVAKELDSFATTQTIVGKPSYVPPEQFRGQANTQSDIYAMGATLFFLLTGRDPEPITVAHPKDIATGISAELDNLISNMTQQKTTDRCQSIEEVRAFIDAHAACSRLT